MFVRIKHFCSFGIGASGERPPTASARSRPVPTSFLTAIHRYTLPRKKTGSLVDKVKSQRICPIEKHRLRVSSACQWRCQILCFRPQVHCHCSQVASLSKTREVGTTDECGRLLRLMPEGLRRTSILSASRRGSLTSSYLTLSITLRNSDESIVNEQAKTKEDPLHQFPVSSLSAV